MVSKHMKNLKMNNIKNNDEYLQMGKLKIIRLIFVLSFIIFGFVALFAMVGNNFIWSIRCISDYAAIIALCWFLFKSIKHSEQYENIPFYLTIIIFTTIILLLIGFVAYKIFAFGTLTHDLLSVAFNVATSLTPIGIYYLLQFNIGNIEKTEREEKEKCMDLNK